MLHQLIRFCVERRLAVLLTTILIAAYGIKAYLDTSIEAFPDVTNYQVNVIAQVPGLAPEEVERQITIPLERELNGIPQMRLMRSESLFGLSLIFLVFEDDADVFKARTRVTERLASANLPENAEVSLAPEATPLGEIYQFRLVSDRHSLIELRSELEWNVRKVLRQVRGVADVVPNGGFLKEVHVEVDPERLLAHGLTVEDVSEALEGSNRNVGGGFLRRGEQELTIRGVGYVTNPEDIRHVVVHNEDGTPITVGDVARLVVSHTPRRGSVGYNLELDAAEGFVLLRRGENPAEVLEGIYQKVEELNDKVLPKGMRIEVFYDRGELLDRTLATVQGNLAEGALLVFGVVWLFLRSYRASLVVTTIIPLALLSAFIGLHFLGLPANLISMGAIDFGILVDGAVVLVENVMHESSQRPPTTKREVRKLVFRATLKVAKASSFGMAIIIAGLIPIFTLEGVEGRIFRPLSMTYSFAILGALLFALTAIPALCALVLRPQDLQIKSEGSFARIQRVYRRAIEFTLRRRALVAVLGLGLLSLGSIAAARLGTEFLPELDEGDFVVFVEMPASISMEEGQEILLEVRRRMLAFPEVKEVLSEHGRPEDGTDNEGVNMSETFVRLHAEEDWRPGWDKQRLIQSMRASLAEIPGVSFNFSQPIKDNVEEAVSGVRGKVVLKIFGTDLGQMRSTLERSLLAIQEVPGVVDLSLYRDADVPQLQVVLDRRALARAGISVDAAQDVVETALGGRVVTEFWEGEMPVPIRVRFPLTERADETRIADIRLRTAAGSQVPLREVAEIEHASGRASIVREANTRVMALKFNVEGRDMGSVVNDAIAAVESQVEVPDGNYLVWTGEFENQQRAMKRLGVVVPLSFIGIVSLLYAALGSTRSAATVMTVVPFAMVGGVVSLLLVEIPLGISAAVGFITLLGGVSAWSLLVVSAADDRRRAGESKLEAIVNGACERLRAVMMTGLLAISGLIPMALASGAGSEIQRPFAVVVIGGVFTAMFATLFLLPLLYALLAPKQPPALTSEVEQ